MKGDVAVCIDCARPFVQSWNLQTVCNECEIKAQQRDARKAEITDKALLKFLKASPADRMKIGRTMRVSRHKGKKEPAEIPTCSKCGKQRVLDPCRECASPKQAERYPVPAAEEPWFDLNQRQNLEHPYHDPEQEGSDLGSHDVSCVIGGGPPCPECAMAESSAGGET